MSRFFYNKKRFTALLLAAVMCFAVLSAICIIGAEAGHDCSGEDCLICCQISICHNILKSIGVIVFFAAAAFALCFISARFCIFTEKIREFFTLVTLNIKLSD